jgi:hypothetical protein
MSLFRIMRLFDIYGNYFQLRLGDQSKFKTPFGGLFTILTLLILLFCILNFSSDYVNKRKPRVYTEEGLYQDNEIPVLNGTEYPLKPVMVVVPISFSNVAKPKINYKLNGTFYSNYLEECNRGYTDLYFPEVNVTALSFSLSLYCFNFNDYPITSGGVFSLGYMECARMDNATLSDILSKGKKCTTNSTTIAYTSMTLYTKQFGFNPGSEHTFIYKTLKYYLTFSNTAVSTINIFWNIEILQDDKGWLIESLHNTTDLAPQREDVQLTQVTSTKIPLYSITFYLGEKYKIHNRSYEKLGDVLAAIGGFMQLILALGNTISGYLKSYSIDMHILNEKFGSDGVNLEKGNNEKGVVDHKVSKSNIVIFNNSMQGIFISLYSSKQ